MATYKQKLIVLLSILWSCSFGFQAYAQHSTPKFKSFRLEKAPKSSYTSIQFGPDKRLYTATQDGKIKIFKIKRTQEKYIAQNQETIDLINLIPNHNDDGTLANGPRSKNRLVTGLVVSGTATQPILYISSSDPRMRRDDRKLIDTNSGVISRITRNPKGQWEKLDLVRGLPRSRENHAPNGMALDTEKRVLYVAMGGHTNAGEPSNVMGFLTEYALSAAVLEIDLKKLDKLPIKGTGNQRYIYDLPTLDDPTRQNLDSGQDIGDPFGGNMGLNQAKVIPDGPVQVFASGFRNPYDLLLDSQGRLFVTDNGANEGWGSVPMNNGTPDVNNNYDDASDNIILNNKSGLHQIQRGYYGGHPNPVRANPNGAGLYTINKNEKVWRTKKTGPHPLPIDWPPVPSPNPKEGKYLQAGEEDSALVIMGPSSNGITEYTASHFNGVLKGQLLVAEFVWSKIFHIQLDPQGKRLINPIIPDTKAPKDLYDTAGAFPLDLIALDDHTSFPGTIWYTAFKDKSIHILEPDESEPKKNQTTADSNHWQEINTQGVIQQRHENAFISVGKHLYLLGGRGDKNVNIFDLATQTWSEGPKPPLSLHHFQAVAINHKIYVLGAFSGAYPKESPVEHIYIYNTKTNLWEKGTEIPPNRRRGAAAACVYQGKIYLAGGLTDGHKGGFTKWLDSFDPASGKWSELDDLPRARDHFQMDVLNHKLYLVGGRKTGFQDQLFQATVPETDIYDLKSRNWLQADDLLTPRAGSTTIAFNNEILVIGGESGSQEKAHAEVEALNPQTGKWEPKTQLQTGRHGTQVTGHKGSLYIAAGSGKRGGGPELASLEIYYPEESGQKPAPLSETPSAPYILISIIMTLGFGGLAYTLFKK